MPTWNVVTAIGGIETLRQLGSLGEAIFKAAKSLTAWEYLQLVKRLQKTLKNFVVSGIETEAK